MAKDAVSSLDENARRYYLEMMGIQCWQSLDSQKQQAVEQKLQQRSDRDVASSLNKQEIINWPQLESSIQQCKKCALHKTRKQTITGRGNQSADLMFILMSPDSADDEAGVLCSSEAKELLDKMLAAINVSINDVYITSLLKCTVPAQHTISPAEIQQCNNYLKQQIQLVQPELFVVLGAAAIQCVLQKDLPLDDFRTKINAEIKTGVSTGNALTTNQYQFESVPLFVSYSPRELLQNPENKRKAWFDLQQLQKIIERI